MNYIHKISNKSQIFSCSASVIKLYMILASDCTVDGGEIISRRLVTNSCVSKEGLKHLIDEKMVHIDGAHIYLGEEGALYVNSTDGVATVLEKIQEDYANNYLKKRRKDTSVTEMWEKAAQYYAYPTTVRKGYDLLCAYQGVYAIVHQQYHRQCTQKELGLMNHMLRMFGSEKSLQIIGVYLMTEERPNITHMFTNKDSVLSGERSEKTSSHEDADDF